MNPNVSLVIAHFGQISVILFIGFHRNIPTNNQCQPIDIAHEFDFYRYFHAQPS